MKWLYVNDLLVRTEEALIAVVEFYSKKGVPIKMQLVDTDENGRYIVPVIDPMET
jgi:hypothetical protein